MGYLGLVPSEHSSGEKTSRGSITKTGNAHARRLLTEAAWNYRFKARIGREALARQEALSESIRTTAWKAQLRLTQRFAALRNRGVQINKACVAVARELAGRTASQRLSCFASTKRLFVISHTRQFSGTDVGPVFRRLPAKRAHAVGDDVARQHRAALRVSDAQRPFGAERRPSFSSAPSRERRAQQETTRDDGDQLLERQHWAPGRTTLGQWRHRVNTEPRRAWRRR